MSRNIFEDLQSAFPSAPEDPSEPVAHAMPGGEAPPPYSTLPASAVEFPQPQWSGPVAGYECLGYSLAGMKLSYMDFVPRLVRKRMIGKDEYESFSTLLQRANTWLEDHANLQLISCETVTWHGQSQKDIFSDSSVFRRVAGVTTYIRGIRFWYLTKMVPSPARGPQGLQTVHCLTVPARATETISQLMKRVNDRITEKANFGRIISVETIRLDSEDGVVNTETTIWKEDSTDTRKFNVAVRVFSVSQQTSTKEAVGYQDFIPEKTARSKDNRGYELHSDLMERAGRWIARQQSVRFTNIQTVAIKIKKHAGFEERCSFTEHGRRPTMYLHIVRAYFVIQKTAPGASVEQPLSARLTYRTFSPFQIAAAMGSTPAKFEDVRTLLERINHWVQLTGAHLFSIETLPVRMGSQLGSNATFVPNQDGGSRSARFLYLIRIYVNGDYIETPAAATLVF